MGALYSSHKVAADETMLHLLNRRAKE